jgi:hypothetical protein
MVKLPPCSKWGIGQEANYTDDVFGINTLSRSAEKMGGLAKQ